jgi:hypothetical protein
LHRCYTAFPSLPVQFGVTEWYGAIPGDSFKSRKRSSLFYAAVRRIVGVTCLAGISEGLAMWKMDPVPVFS